MAAEWLVERVKHQLSTGERPTTRVLDAYRGLQRLRRDLIGRNASPQMIAERLLLGLRDATAAS